MISSWKICKKKNSLILWKNEDNFVQSSVEENRIIFDTIENLVLCKSIFNLVYIGITDNFCEYLQSLPQNAFEDIDQNLRSTGIFFENLQHETDPKEIINAFNYFFYMWVVSR